MASSSLLCTIMFIIHRCNLPKGFEVVSWMVLQVSASMWGNCSLVQRFSSIFLMFHLFYLYFSPMTVLICIILLFWPLGQQKKTTSGTLLLLFWMVLRCFPRPGGPLLVKTNITQQRSLQNAKNKRIPKHFFFFFFFSVVTYFKMKAWVSSEKNNE